MVRNTNVLTVLSGDGFAYREGCHEEFKAAQALWDELSAVCRSCERHRILFYQGGQPGAEACAEAAAGAGDCGDFLRDYPACRQE